MIKLRKSGWVSWIKIPAWSLVVLLALYAGTCWYILNVTITPMRKLPTVAPGQLGFSTAKELAFKSAEDGVLLRGWLVPSTGSRAIVLVHGINSHAWDGHAPEVVRAYVDAGFHVLHIRGQVLQSNIPLLGPSQGLTTRRL